jgi:excinuclease UvrABC nuclease subunit
MIEKGRNEGLADRSVLGIDSFPTMRMQSSNPAFNLIRNLRDEAHRFSKKYHTSLRGKLL